MVPTRQAGYEQTLGSAQGLYKVCLNEISFLWSDGSTCMCKSRDLSTAVYQGKQCVCGPFTIDVDDNVGSVYRDLPDSDKTTKSQF